MKQFRERLPPCDFYLEKCRRGTTAKVDVRIYIPLYLYIYICIYIHVYMYIHTYMYLRCTHMLCSQYRCTRICTRTYTEARVHHTSARVSKWNEISLLFIARASEYQRTSAATCRLCRAALSRLTAVSKELLCDERAGST